MMRVEPLENRLLLAADLDVSIEHHNDQDDLFVVSSVGEGEHAGTLSQDLVAFAQDLSTAGVTFFGAAWCPACTAQKELFEDGADFLPFVEVTNPDRSLNQLGIDEGISAFPTWEFPDGSRLPGVQSLDTLSTRSGVAIAMGTNPFIAPIGDTTVLGGSPLHVALNGYDPDDTSLTYTVSSSNPSLVDPTLLLGRKSARVSFDGFGDTVYQLHDQRADVAAGRFMALANSGFYDAANNNPPIGVHRVDHNFVIQFGDPTGTGSGGSSLGDFDDDFHPDLQHNNVGTLSFAKSGDDTNDSQVFVIDTTARFLDGNHSVIGQLTEGDSNRDAINSTAVDGSDRPLVPVRINSISIFDDTENALVMLKAPEGASGEADITVTATDDDGHEYVETFHVTVTPDTFNTGPWLNDVPAVMTTVNTPATIQLTSTDVEGDPVFYDAAQQGSVPYTFDVNNSTGVVTVTPPTDFVGTFQILTAVRALNGSDTADTFDTQSVTVAVAPEAPVFVDLLEGSDSGFLNDDDLTGLTELNFNVAGTTDGAIVRLYSGGNVFATGEANGSSVVIPTSNLNGSDGLKSITATQLFNSVESDPSPVLEVHVDRTAPVEPTSQPPSNGTVGQSLVYNTEHPEEGDSGFSYSLTEGPSGASIASDTGVLTWTPTGDQIGANDFTIMAIDGAGNEGTHQFQVQVSSNAQVVMRLETTDTSGVPVSSLDVGDAFLLRGHVEDLNAFPEGVFTAYMDVVYDDSLVGVTGPISYGSEYSNVASGDTSTPGLVDEVGATAGLTPTGSGEYLVFSLPMQATHSGLVTFVGNAPDNLPFHEILLYGTDDPVPLDEVQFGSTSLTIDLAFGANNDVFNVDEDSQDNTLDPLDNDEFQSGSSGQLEIVSVGTPDKNGQVSISADNLMVTYTPAPDFFGLETFTYTVSDGTGNDTATVTVQVQPANDPPTAVDDDETVLEDSFENFLDLTINDLIDPDEGESLSITSVGAPSNGATLTLGPGGSHVLYTPAADFFGIETFTYIVSDGNGGTDEGLATVRVAETNDPPNAFSDQFDVTEDASAVELDVLINDDTAGEPNETLTIDSLTVPNNGGTVSIENGKVLYTPAADFFGRETFRYTIDDGNGGQDETLVIVDVSPTNDPPQANDDDLTAVKGVSGQLLDVMSNDSIAPDEGETLTIIDASAPTAGGIVSVNSIGTELRYTPPDTEFTGEDTFTYTISDGSGETSTATARVTVLDFAPSLISGFTYIDVNNNGLHDSPEMEIGGVVITLTGTDFQGTSVEMTDVTTGDGFYEFRDLAPGTYTITQTHPQFMLDGMDTLGSLGGDDSVNDQFTLDLPQDSEATNYNFGERGRRPEHIYMIDFLASTPVDTILAATDDTGDSLWYSARRGWEEYATTPVSQPRVEAVQVTAVDTTQQTTLVSDEIATTDVERVRMLGESVGSHLVRVVGASSRYNLVSTASNGAGEGESVVTQTTPQVTVPSEDPPASTPAQAEGEATRQPSTTTELGLPLITDEQASEETDADAADAPVVALGLAAPSVDQVMAELGGAPRVVDAIADTADDELSQTTYELTVDQLMADGLLEDLQSRLAISS